MAFVRPSLVVDTTATSGAITYTLDNGDPGGGFRTLADAVADGDVSAGDTISYFVVDTTTKGATLQWEHGTGTVGAGGLTLARTSIIESSNADAAVSWGSGGSRTVRFGAGTAGFALLAATNTWPAVQTFTAGFAANESSKVKKTGAVAALDVGSSLSSLSTTLGRYGVLGHSSTGVERVAAQWQAIWTDATNGSEDALWRAVVMVNGTGTVVAQIDSGGVKDAAGTYYALTGVLSAPSATNIFFPLQSTVPTGFSKVTAHNDAALRVVSGTVAPTGGTRGLSSSTVGSTSLSLAQIPSHYHSTEALLVGTAGSNINIPVNPYAGTGTERQTDSKGSGDSHDHALALKYVDGVIGTKT